MPPKNKIRTKKKVKKNIKRLNLYRSRLVFIFLSSDRWISWADQRRSKLQTNGEATGRTRLFLASCPPSSNAHPRPAEAIPSVFHDNHTYYKTGDGI